MAPALFFLGIGPLARWRNARVPELAVRLRWALAASVAGSIAIPLAVGEWKPLVSLGLFLSLWIVATIVVSLSETLAPGGSWRGWVSRTQSSRRSFYGMHLAHAGMAVSIIGITIVTGYEDEKDLRMAAGDQARVGGYSFTLKRVKEVKGPNYIAAQADIDVSRQDGQVFRTLGPQKRLYLSSQNAMTETAIDAGVFRDLYVSLGEPLSGGAWQVRIQYKPFVDWIWFGAILMALGGALAVSDPRHARALARRSAPTAPPPAAKRAGGLPVRTDPAGARS
jgi:cytochrome c-type biogenesis protein CcmF